VTQPLVSVVVPTRSRPERLGRLLDALRAQTLGSDKFEVIVVADGACGQTLARLAEERRRSDLSLRVISNPAPRGPAAARNAGWRRASASTVAFTDDDCTPSERWLEEGLGAADAQTVVQGVTEPDPAEADRDGVFSRTVRVSSLGPQYETCNIFYPRALLERLDGFDERYGLTPGGEDTDLAWRAIEAGYGTRLAPEAVVYHGLERLGARGMLRVAARWSTPMLVFADHPQTRSMLFGEVFWNVWHYLMWRSLAALLAPRWLRGMILTLHLVQLRRRCRRSGAGSWAIPFLIVHDLVECWAVARGALRYRTLVL